MKIIKAILAAVGLIITTLGGALADNVLNFNEISSVITQIILGAASVYAVWRVPNSGGEVKNVTMDIDPSDPNFYRNS